MWPSLAIALVLATAIAFAAFRRGSLSASGAVAAVVVGTIVFAGGGVAWGAVLIVFFVSSSLLGRLQSAPKGRAESVFAKGHRRDAGQVLANGGIAAVLAAGHAIDGGELWWPAFLGAMAAVTADTWATEVGTLSRQPPRLITTWAPVTAGTSGGVTPNGLAASLAGAIVIGFVGGIAAPFQAFSTTMLVAITGGLLGSVVDSLLGATLQAAYHCDRCGQPTEARRHRCGTTSRPVRGVGWIDNDIVNLAAALFGAAAAGVVSLF